MAERVEDQGMMLSRTACEMGSSLCLAVGGSAGLFAMMLRMIDPTDQALAWGCGGVLVAGIAGCIGLSLVATRAADEGGVHPPIPMPGQGADRTESGTRRAA